MESFFVRNKLSLALMGLAILILGGFILFNPGATTTFIAQVLGWVLIIWGAGTAALALFNGDTQRNSGMSIALGILMFIAGLFCVMMPHLIVAYIFVFLGLVVALNGVGDFVRANASRKAGGEQWKVGMIIAILSIIAGIAIVVSPFVAATLVTTIVGIALVFDGASELVTAFLL